ncbi:hypothetical protein KIW84_064722 [Lathyrus oleraceus]|uniref:Uncharacterized protein n=1 Tax=Pisum sativum TaxID=3888 RepID=A0A9D5A6J3_PEA|nr:hypothetical protein KIW84_064722 [Pisum sativum]
MASFSSRTYGPHWFKIKFSTLSPGNQFEAVNIWVDFFKPTILSTRISIGKVGLGHVGNQPNWVARLFGFSQFLPRSLFTKDVEICLATTTLTKKVYKACLDFHAKKIINLSPFKFEAFFHCTKEFDEWWTRYHNSVVYDQRVDEEDNEVEEKDKNDDHEESEKVIPICVTPLPVHIAADAQQSTPWGASNNKELDAYKILNSNQPLTNSPPK